MVVDGVGNADVESSFRADGALAAISACDGAAKNNVAAVAKATTPGRLSVLMRSQTMMSQTLCCADPRRL